MNARMSLDPPNTPVATMETGMEFAIWMTLVQKSRAYLNTRVAPILTAMVCRTMKTSVRLDLVLLKTADVLFQVMVEVTERDLMVMAMVSPTPSTFVRSARVELNTTGVHHPGMKQMQGTKEGQIQS